ncbi:MAG: bifunctional adenosylcobinamide kinase/adenosylcobinamide-phosphate guanylyltransferase [Alphaproteobacteria bacterium]
MPADIHLPPLTFVLGGARSGKSAYALALAEAAVTIDAAAPDLLIVATAEAGDEEMTARIAHHKAVRGPRWRAVESPVALSAALREHCAPGRVIVVDCITLWLSNLLHAGQDPELACRDLLDTLAGAPGQVIVISNEVGMGIVPDNALARKFRDHAGWMHQRIAAQADRVMLITAGLAFPLK